MPATQWLEKFSEIDMRGRKWILLDQDELSQETSRKIGPAEFYRLKTHLSRMAVHFTAGDVVAYLPPIYPGQLIGKNRIQAGKRLPWNYFLLKKVLGQWKVYGMGQELLATDPNLDTKDHKKHEDKPDKIIW